jgi:hypothetical protein
MRDPRLCAVMWLETDVSVLPIGSIFKGQDAQKNVRFGTTNRSHLQGLSCPRIDISGLPIGQAVHQEGRGSTSASAFLLIIAL